MPLTSSAYEVPVTLESVIIAIDAKILTDDITITKEFLGGTSGVLRLWFSMGAVSDFQLVVTKKGLADLTGNPLTLNSDNAFVLKSNGYYRFDIGVRVGDLINLSSNVAIDDIFEFQVQQIRIGA